MPDAGLWVQRVDLKSGLLLSVAFSLESVWEAGRAQRSRGAGVSVTEPWASAVSDVMGMTWRAWDREMPQEKGARRPEAWPEYLLGAEGPLFGDVASVFRMFVAWDSVTVGSEVLPRVSSFLPLPASQLAAPSGVLASCLTSDRRPSVSQVQVKSFCTEVLLFDLSVKGRV